MIPSSSTASPWAQQNHRVLLVDDTPSIHEDFRKILMTATESTDFSDLENAVLGAADEPAAPPPDTFELAHAYQGEEALQMVQNSLDTDHPFAVAFVDMRMPPGWDGLETSKRLRECDPRIQIIICTAYSDHTWTRITEVLRPADNVLILKKPFDNIEALQLAHTLSTKWSLQRQVETRLDNLNTLARSRGDALAAAEQRFSAAFFGGARAYVIVSLPDGKVIQTNPAFNRLMGLTSPPADQKIEEVLGWHSGDKIQAALTQLSAGHTPDDFDIALPSGAGERRYLRLSGSPFIEAGLARCLFSIADISESRKLEQQLHRSQKMEAMGSLAAGIAHDFNNVLTVISGFTSVVQLDEQLSPTIRGQLDHVVNAAERAANLTRQLLVFSRRKTGDVTEFDPAATALGMKSMLNRLINESIQLNWHCPVGTCTIIADESGFEQVVMNLIVNARDAVIENGSIKIEIEPVEVQSAPRNKMAEPHQSGTYVRLKVADTGCGMSPEVISRIFEPFYTNKAPDQGTGLGLATVYGIVKRSHGWVNVTSEPDQGATFEVYFPMAGTNVVDSSAPLVPLTEVHDRNLRFLVVEDDPVVLDLLKFMLGHHRFELCLATDSPSALRQWQEQQGRFDVLLTDLVLPGGMNGRDLAETLRKDDPNIAVVIASGYDDNTVPSLALPVGPDPIFIAKPYNSASLLVAIESAVAANA